MEMFNDHICENDEKERKNIHLLGKSNEMAVSLILSENEYNKTFFPLIVLYAPPGCGITTVVELVEKRGKELGKKITVKKCTDFTNEIIDSMKNFHDDLILKYSKTDILIIEDVDTDLKGKISTQKYMMDIVERMVSEEKQIMFTMSIAPNKLLSGLDERLKEKLQNSVYLELQPPTKKMRKALVKCWKKENELNISKKAISIIVQATDSSSYSTIYGVLKQLELYWNFFEKKIDKKLAKRILRQRRLLE